MIVCYKLNISDNINNAIEWVFVLAVSSNVHFLFTSINQSTCVMCKSVFSSNAEWQDEVFLQIHFHLIWSELHSTHHRSTCFIFRTFFLNVLVSCGEFLDIVVSCIRHDLPRVSKVSIKHGVNINIIGSDC